MRRLAVGTVVGCALASAGSAQVAGVEVLLATGQVLVASAITGEPGQALELTIGKEQRRIEPGLVLVVSGVAARAVDLPAAHLAFGEVVRGALVGGDAAGDQLHMLSPVLGRVDLAVERLAAFASHSAVQPQRLHLPQGVGEALFQRAAVGYDLVAGTLHQFGEQGVRFQPEGAAAPRWFPLQDFVALRLTDAVAPPSRAPVDLVTRTGDHLGVVVRRFASDVVHCEREGGAAFELRLSDLACLSFVGGVTFASDLEPVAVDESGFDGDVVHPWQRDASVTGSPLVVGGRTHGKGLGTHSRSKLSFAVPAAAASFWTRVGLDDSSAELGIAAAVDVRVLVGGVVKFEGKALRSGVVADTGLLAVRPGEVVTLETDFGSGRDLGDRVDWLSPVFLPAPGRRP